MEPSRYKVTNPESSMYGLEGTVTLVYYDYQRTGSSANLVYLTLDDGRSVRFFSTSLTPIEEPVEVAVGE